MIVDYLTNNEPTVFDKNYTARSHAKLGAAAFTGATVLLTLFSLGAIATLGTPIAGISGIVSFLGVEGAIALGSVIGAVALAALWRGIRHSFYYPTAQKKEFHYENPSLPPALAPPPSILSPRPRNGAPLLPEPESEQAPGINAAKPAPSLTGLIFEEIPTAVTKGMTAQLQVFLIMIIAYLANRNPSMPHLPSNHTPDVD